MRVAPGELESVADVARVFEPMFGPASQALFCVGLLAGAFSSFLVNVMIGGTVLSDGLGLGGDLDGRWPRAFTAAALGVGMLVALMIEAAGFSPVRLILFAQALTVLGNPVLAAVLMWLGTRPGVGAPRWMLALAAVGVLIVTTLSVSTAARVIEALS